MNLGFYESGPLSLDASRFVGEPEVEAFANVLRDEIEKRRGALGGVYGGKHRISEAAALLLGESIPVPKKIDYLNARKWFEFLTDMDVIRNVERRTGITILQFLSMCIDKLCPPNWETLFWMRAAFEVGIGEEQLLVQLALRKEVAGRQARTEMATKGARAKLAMDPKQRDKASVRECFDEWRKQPSRYKSKAAFARDMREKFPSLESQPVIEGWCRAWERET